MTKDVLYLTAKVKRKPVGLKSWSRKNTSFPLIGNKNKGFNLNKRQGKRRGSLRRPREVPGTHRNNSQNQKLNNFLNKNLQKLPMMIQNLTLMMNL